MNLSIMDSSSLDAIAAAAAVDDDEEYNYEHKDLDDAILTWFCISCT